MENTLSIKRSDQVKKFPEKYIASLEDKRASLILEARRVVLREYRRKRFWPLLTTTLLCWLVVPVLVWQHYRTRLPEWDVLKKMNYELDQLKIQRKQRKFWKKMWSQKNQLRTENFHEINQFYKTLIHSTRQYNIRLDLFDYALDRQNKHLDPPFTVGELEQIELTFQRIYDELNSAIKLLDVAEQNPDMDLATLLSDQYTNLHTSSEYVSQTVDIANSGQFVQELLVIETSLKEDIANLSKQNENSSRSEYVDSFSAK
ncbi:MAG: hypothetical protein HQM13_10615 [SAR324 cluster bacterium]|nr:hypothetical protein [SAR324 cluster bacterium]